MAKKFLDNQQIDVDEQGYVSVAVKAQTGGGLTDTELRATSVPVTEASAVAIKNAVEIIDNAISGSEMQVDMVAPIPAGDNNIGNVDIASALPAGTNVIGGVNGDVAHDAADSGNSIKVGHKAIAHGTNPTAVAAGDRTDSYANRAGVPFVIAGHPNIITLEVAYTAAQTDAAIITVGAGVKIVITNIAVLADNANTVDVGFRVGFGAANTPTTTGVVLTHPGLAAGSGFDRGSGAGILGIGADGEDLRITSEVPTTGSIRVLVSYYTIES